MSFGNRSLIPSKIVCIGRNYAEHIAELKNEVPDDMVVFIKPNSAISEQLQSVHQEALSYEGEICFLVEGGRFSAVAFGLDITKRTLQGRLKAKGLPWERAKGFDGSALFSRFVALDAIDPALSIELDINGVTVQRGQVGQMLYRPAEILAELKTFLTLNDGDIVMTGTPSGVDIIHPGDCFLGKIKLNDEILTSAEWQAV